MQTLHFAGLRKDVLHLDAAGQFFCHGLSGLIAGAVGTSWIAGLPKSCMPAKSAPQLQQFLLVSNRPQFQKDSCYRGEANRTTLFKVIPKQLRETDVKQAINNIFKRPSTLNRRAGAGSRLSGLLPGAAATLAARPATPLQGAASSLQGVICR